MPQISESGEHRAFLVRRLWNGLKLLESMTVQSWRGVRDSRRRLSETRISFPGWQACCAIAALAARLDVAPLLGHTFRGESLATIGYALHWSRKPCIVFLVVPNHDAGWRGAPLLGGSNLGEGGLPRWIIVLHYSHPSKRRLQLLVFFQ